jgi:hypothetical protein
MIRTIALLLASSLVACHHEPGHEVHIPTDYVAPAYEANLKGKDLACCIVRDTLHTPVQPLQPGQGSPSDPASWNDANGALQMQLAGAGSMGVFSTGLDFGKGKIFSVSATFRNPKVIGAASEKPWTIVIAARTGDVDDADNLGRLQVSMQTLPLQPSENINRVELRVQEGRNIGEMMRIGEARKTITGLVHDEIFGSPNPFTITLIVDRATGRGGAILTTKTQTVELEFEQALFSEDNGDPLTVAGAVLVNQAAGRSVSVEVTHFEIWDNTP